MDFLSGNFQRDVKMKCAPNNGGPMRWSEGEKYVKHLGVVQSPIRAYMQLHMNDIRRPNRKRGPMPEHGTQFEANSQYKRFVQECDFALDLPFNRGRLCRTV